MIARLLGPILAASPKSVLILGPRQVGKSTLIQDLKPQLTINLADDQTFLEFKSNPGELKQRLAALPNLKSVLIDEVQRHPTILNTLQTIIDDKRAKPPKFFLTGSSARKLRRGQANLLPGRIFSYELGPLAASELTYQLNVPHALKYGCLPEPYLSHSDSFCQKLLTTYAGIYLKEEIQAEAMTRNLEGFSRFLASAAQNSGRILDFSKMAKQARIERKLCSRFYEILEDTLVAARLEVFAETTADISKRPKFYFFDTGVLNGLLVNFAASNDRKGTLFEHLVINQVITSAKARDLSIKTSYFRTRGGYEVDLILQIGAKTFAVEIKSGRVDQSDASRLEEFRNYYSEVNAFFIVTPEETPRSIGPVRVLSVNDFLREAGL